MWTLILLFSAVLLLIAYFDTKKPKNFPPGPKWLPLLGSLLEIYHLRKKTGRLLLATNELCKQYGPIVGVKTGLDLQIILFKHDAIREMLSEDIFQARPTGLLCSARTLGERLGILVADDDSWAEQRRFLIKHLKEFGLGTQNMGVIIEKESQELVKYLLGKMGVDKTAIIEMSRSFTVPILNTTWCMLSGIRYNLEDSQLITLQGLLEEIFNGVDMVGAVFTYFPFLRYVAPELSGYNSYVKVHDHLYDFFREEIEKHKAAFQAGNAKDFIDVYLEVLYKPDKNQSFSERQLLAICLDMFQAGFDTTSRVLSTTFLYFLLYPDVQKKAQAEIDTVIGRERTPTLSDRVNMPYIQAAVHEGLRMAVGQTFMPPHRALQDTTLHGYFIPKDSILVANMHGHLMSEELWSDPEVFRPERFLKDDQINIPSAYFPFGLGKRRCLGESVAKANLFLFTTSLLQRFTFSVPPGHIVSQTEILDELIPTPKPYHALLNQRY